MPVGTIAFALAWKDMIVKFAETVVSVVALVVVEVLADEPILSLHLFTGRVFIVATRTAAAGSGLLVNPMMVGLMATSTESGLAITRTGRYRIYPIVGLAASSNNDFRGSGAAIGTAWSGSLFTDRLISIVTDTEGAHPEPVMTAGPIRAGSRRHSWLPCPTRCTGDRGLPTPTPWPPLRYVVPALGVALLLAFFLPPGHSQRQGGHDRARRGRVGRRQRRRHGHRRHPA